MGKRRKALTLAKGALHRFAVVTGALVMTLACFLVLPLMQVIRPNSDANLIVQGLDVANLPPPPPPPEKEPEKEPEEEEEPPELMEEAPPLDLLQLELRLNPTLSDGWLSGDFAMKLNTHVTSSRNTEELFTVSDLDQPPRAIYQPSPTLTPKLRSRTPAKVYVLFDINERGVVERAKVSRSTESAFDRVTLDAVKKWKFEPCKRDGKAVKVRRRIPIDYPAAR